MNWCRVQAFVWVVGVCGGGLIFVGKEVVVGVGTTFLEVSVLFIESINRLCA